MNGPKAPAPLDVSKVAQQGNQQNTSNAFQQTAFNRLGQKDALGNSLDYSQNGADAQGNPIFQANQSFGDAGKAAAGGFSALGGQYLNRAQDMMAHPLDTTNAATENRIADLGARRLDPQFQRSESALQNRLSNQGLDPTSEAYRAEMDTFNRGKNDAYDNLALTARGQAFGEAVGGRNQQVQEMGQLPQGYAGTVGRFMSPNYVQTPGVNVGNVDVAGLNSQSKQQEWQAYTEAQKQHGAMIGGLAGIGGSMLMAPMTGGTSLGGMGMKQMGRMFG